MEKKIKPAPLNYFRDKKVREQLWDLLQSNSKESIIRFFQSEIHKIEKEKNVRMKRLKWCISVVYDKEDIDNYILNQLNKYFNFATLSKDAIFIQGASVEQEHASLCEEAFGWSFDSLDHNSDGTINHEVYTDLEDFIDRVNELEAEGLVNGDDFWANEDSYEYGEGWDIYYDN